MKNTKIKTHVFISYARSDAAEVANLLQRRLEGYRIPRKLVGKDVPLPEGKYLRRVFVDTEDLSVSKESFHAQLKHELDEAEYLIVLCSKAAARDDSFVHKEIEYFTKKNGGDTSRILPIALDGVGSDAIPAELQGIVKERNIVLWDREWPTQGRLGKAHLHSAFFKVLEFLLGVDAGVLNNRYWITWRRRMLVVASVIACTLVTMIGVLAYGVMNQVHRVKFEKQVFPLSIDYSYMEAFVKPLIQFANAEHKHCILVAAMPKNYAETGNRPWNKLTAVKRDLDALGWTCNDKTYERPQSKNYGKHKNSRPLKTLEIRPNGVSIVNTNIFVDVVSQLSAVRKVLDYLTEDNPFHSMDDVESLAKEYIGEFEQKLIELLNDESKEGRELFGSSWEVRFVKDRDELKAALDSISK